MTKIQSTKDYQALTNKILREATFGAGTAADYINPIRATEMQGHFFRRLKTSRLKYWRLFFGLTFFILPALAIIAIPVYIVDHWSVLSVLAYSLFVLFCALNILVGIKIIKNN